MFPPLFTFLLAMRNVVTNKTPKNTTNKSILVFLSLFSDRLPFVPLFQICFSLSSFRFAKSRASVTRVANRPGMWMARSTTSLSHSISTMTVSSTATMVMRSAPIQVSVFFPFFTIPLPPFLFLHFLCNELWLATKRK